MKICTITISEKEYNLCLVRDSIKYMENRGIKIQDIDTKPLSFIDGMWCSLFVKNYADMKESDCIELLEQYRADGGDVMEVIKYAIDEYTAFMNALNGTKSSKKAKITKA